MEGTDNPPISNAKGGDDRRAHPQPAGTENPLARKKREEEESRERKRRKEEENRERKRRKEEENREKRKRDQERREQSRDDRNAREKRSWQRSDNHRKEKRKRATSNSLDRQADMVERAQITPEALVVRALRVRSRAQAAMFGVICSGLAWSTVKVQDGFAGDSSEYSAQWWAGWAIEPALATLILGPIILMSAASRVGIEITKKVKITFYVVEISATIGTLALSLYPVVSALSDPDQSPGFADFASSVTGPFLAFLGVTVLNTVGSLRIPELSEVEGMASKSAKTVEDTSIEATPPLAPAVAEIAELPLPAAKPKPAPTPEGAPAVKSAPAPKEIASRAEPEGLAEFLPRDESPPSVVDTAPEDWEDMLNGAKNAKDIVVIYLERINPDAAGPELDQVISRRFNVSPGYGRTAKSRWLRERQAASGQG